jgi:uncharacterized membrane protein (DUF4010 family)
MPILLSLLWACFTATCVFHMLSRDSARRVEDATDETFGAAVSSVDPSFAATVTFLFGITAPYFLYRSRGLKGLAQGIGLVLFSMVGCSASLIGLAVLAHR